jgi:hypothetical protein
MGTILAPVLAEPELIRVDDGKIHLRYRIDNRWVKDERCNTGQVKFVVAAYSDVESADPDDLCDYCFDR